MTEDNDNIPSPDDSTLDPPAISPTPSSGSMSDTLIGTKIGSCTLRRFIASGGMGSVYEAIQEKPRRRVAVKMIKKGIASRSALRRFEFESQTLARLQHPGVAQIFEASTHDDGSGGVPYFVMEYIANAKPITKYADEKKLGTKERLALFLKVCDAVQHGHLKGILHRDLKPGNILVDSSGQPKIIDFGVARSTDSDLAQVTLQTDVGQLIGTLQYMSPEQCEADSSDIDFRSDVYALGVILYELLTGNPPYDIRQKATLEAIRIVCEEEPTRLSSINRKLRGDIETIALKALGKERDRRYQSAVALQEDILHYLNDEPISAKPPGAIDYILRFARRHTAATVATLAVFALVVPLCTFAYFYVQNESTRTSLRNAEHDGELALKDAEMEANARVMDVIEQESEKTKHAMIGAVIGQIQTQVSNDLLKNSVFIKINQHYDKMKELQLFYNLDISNPQNSIVIIPLEGMLETPATMSRRPQATHQGTFFSPFLLDQLLDEIHQQYPDLTTVVFEFNSGGGAVGAIEEFADVIDKHIRHFRIVGWVDVAGGSSMILSFICPELIMKSSAQFVFDFLPSDTSWAASGLGDLFAVEMPNKIHAIMKAVVEGKEVWYDDEERVFASWSGSEKPDEIVKQMAEDSQRWKKVNTGDITSTFAVESNLANGIADTTDDLLEVLGIDPYPLDSPLSELGGVYYTNQKMDFLKNSYAWTEGGRLDEILEQAINTLYLLSTGDEKRIIDHAVSLEIGKSNISDSVTRVKIQNQIRHTLTPGAWINESLAENAWHHWMIRHDSVFAEWKDALTDAIRADDGSREAKELIIDHATRARNYGETVEWETAYSEDIQNDMQYEYLVNSLITRMRRWTMDARMYRDSMNLHDESNELTCVLDRLARFVEDCQEHDPFTSEMILMKGLTTASVSERATSHLSEAMECLQTSQSSPPD